MFLPSSIKNAALVSLLSILLLAPIVADAQVLGTKYLWTDSIKVTTTAIDCTFTQRWESITFWFDGCDATIKVAAPDTFGFTNRCSIKLYEGVPYSFGPATPLKRLLMKASVDSGTCYLVGYKTIRQQ